jgi:hypothetical protein
MTIMPEHAFVQGVSRSGTTAMAQLLNAHPNVCIGIERSKYLVERQKHLSMDLFDKNRFFRFDPGDTNVLAELPRWAPVYKAMSEKWESAHVIGDKLSTRLLRYIARDVPNSRHIYMVRGIDRVASSWNMLALQQKGHGPATTITELLFPGGTKPMALRCATSTRSGLEC